MRHIKDISTLASRVFGSGHSSGYTANELAHLQSYLSSQGYVRASLYANEEKFKDVLRDYVRTDQAGNILGTVTLHIENGEKSPRVQDGIVEVRHDEALMAKTGRITTVSEFVRGVNPTFVQKITKKLGL